MGKAKEDIQTDLWKMLNMGENLTEKQELRNLKFYIETKISSMRTTRQFFKVGSKNDEYCRKWIETYQQMLSTISYYEHEKENFRKKYGD